MPGLGAIVDPGFVLVSALKPAFPQRSRLANHRWLPPALIPGVPPSHAEVLKITSPLLTPFLLRQDVQRLGLDIGSWRGLPELSLAVVALLNGIQGLTNEVQ